MRTAEQAATVACVFVGLYAGHQVGDHTVDSDAVMSAKAIPSDDRLAAGTSPWTGWGACLHHVAVYTLAQAVALVVVFVLAPMSLYGGFTALLISAFSHAIIDRRWIVAAIVRAKRCTDWPEAPYLIDQSLHYGALFTAAACATAVTTAAGVAGTAALGIASIALALALERRLAASAADRIGDPHRL